MADDAESAVRNYLMFLADPASAVDPAATQRLEKRLAAASDPIDKLRAAAELQLAKSPDGRALRDGFVQHARAWAEANSIPASVFREFGIPADVLREAGLGPGATHRRTTRQRTTARSRPRSLRPSVTRASLEEALANRKGEFTLSDVARDHGGSPMTIRRAVRSLLESGVLVECESVRTSARGRSANRFRAVPKAEQKRPRKRAPRRH